MVDAVDADPWCWLNEFYPGRDILEDECLVLRGDQCHRIKTDQGP